MTEDGEIRRVVREVVTEVFDLAPGEVADDINFDVLGGDSVRRMEVIATLGRRLGTRFSVEEETKIHSVRDAVRITRRRLRAA